MSVRPGSDTTLGTSASSTGTLLSSSPNDTAANSVWVFVASLRRYIACIGVCSEILTYQPEPMGGLTENPWYCCLDLVWVVDGSSRLKRPACTLAAASREVMAIALQPLLSMIELRFRAGNASDSVPRGTMTVGFRAVNVRPPATGVGRLPEATSSSRLLQLLTLSKAPPGKRAPQYAQCCA